MFDVIFEMVFSNCCLKSLRAYEFMLYLGWIHIRAHLCVMRKRGCLALILQVAVLRYNKSSPNECFVCI